MSVNSDNELSGASSDSDLSSSSECSEQCSASTSLDLLPYDEELEPLATEQEARDHAEQVAREEEEESRLLRRFSRESDISTWYFVLSPAFVIFCIRILNTVFFNIEVL